MTIEVLPLGVQCNLRCQYCYQNQERDSGHTHLAYDLDAMKAALAAEGGEFTIFGGEALLMPKADLEDLWAWGFERYGHNGVQTNGSLIDDDHIRMFRDYNVSVGVSVDGPGELNDARWVGSLQTTREATAKTQANIERLCAEGMAPSLIITLTRANASADKLPRMSAWLRDLDRRGVPAARLHTLEVETAEIGEHYALTVEETVAAMRRLSALEQQLSMKFDLFGDIEQLQLLNDDAMTCTFAACDPYTTSAVQGVGPRGQRSNCGRAHKEGVDHVKAGTPGFERYLALHNTPQARGGCSGCRFFAMCKGQCPGTAVSGDWRQRTSECSLWKELFRASETSLLSRGVLPLSLRPERKAIEAALLQAWAQGENPTLESIARTLGFAPIAVDLKREQARRAGEPTEVPSDPVPLPDFVRMSWASDTARELWQGRLEQIQRMRIDVALHQAAVQSICRPLLLLPAELMGLRVSARIRELGLTVGHLGLKERSNPAGPVGEFAKRRTHALLHQVVVGEQSRVARAMRAHEAHDWAAWGEACGIPACCAEVQGAGSLDPTWARLEGADTKSSDGGRTRTIRGRWETNILLGTIRLSSTWALPCDVECESARDEARSLLADAVSLGWSQEAQWLEELLSMSIHWSAVHGIAEIRTPIFRIIARTDAVADARAVFWHGARTPSEASKGVVFPYRVPTRLRVSQSKGFVAGLAHARQGSEDGGTVNS